MLKSPKIEVDTGRAKTIAEIICKEIKESIGKNKARYDRAERSERQYAQITKWMAMGKVCDSPWKGGADYFVPLSEWIIDAVWARAMNTLFSQEPYMTAVGTEASDVDKAPGVTDFVDTIFREVVKLRKNFKYFIKQMLKLPFAVLKYDWAQDFEPMIVKEMAQKFISPTGEEKHILPDDENILAITAEMMTNGWQQQGQEEVWVLKEVELENRAKLQYIPFKNYVYSPFAKRGNKLYWEGDKFHMTINEMQLNVQSEKFIKDSVDKIVRELGLEGKEASEKALAERAELRECYWWYGRLPFNKQNEIDFSSSETFEQEVICIVEYKSEELLLIKHWDKRRVPKDDRVYIRGEFEETEDFEGRSLAEKLFMTQRYLNQVYNTIMNNAYIAMMKIFTKKRSWQGDKTKKPKAYPGAIWDVNEHDDIKILDVGDVKAIGWEIEQSLINFAERLSNISIYQTGTERQKGQKTYGEVMATIREGNIGIDNFIQNCHEILRKVCQWTVDYYFENMPPGLERRIRGDQGQLIFPSQQTMPQYNQQKVNPYWENDDLAGKFDFIWKGTSLSASRELEIAVANDLMEQYMPHPMIQGNMLATWDILRRGLEARNIKDWQNILPPKEAIIQEMQKMEAKAKMEQAAPRVGPEVETVMKERLGRERL